MQRSEEISSIHVSVARIVFDRLQQYERQTYVKQHMYLKEFANLCALHILLFIFFRNGYTNYYVLDAIATLKVVCNNNAVYIDK